MTPARLVFMGSAVVDFIYRISSLPGPGEERVAEAYAMLPGGGFNMMAAARAAGLTVACGGRHGTGPHGDFLRAHMAAAGIELLLPADETRDSGSCVVMVTDDAERTFVSYPGADAHLTAELLETVALTEGDRVFVSGYTLSYPGSGAALAAWAAALPDTFPLFIDPGPVAGAIPAALAARVMARTTWLSCNAREAAVLAGREDPHEAAEALVARGTAMEGAVVRMGAQGCVLALAGQEPATIPAFPVSAVDTNGAGDTHLGAFVAALAGGRTPREAAVYANAAAAISVTRRGGAAAPQDVEITTFLARHGA